MKDMLKDQVALVTMVHPVWERQLLNYMRLKVQKLL